MMPLCTSATRPAAPEVRVGVDVVRRAVGGPAGVPDAGRGRRQRRRPRSPSRGWRACRPACRQAIAPVVDQRDPGGVVAAVLQPPQALDHDVLRLLVTDVPHDSAHGRESIERPDRPPTAAPAAATIARMSPHGGGPNGGPDDAGREAVAVRRARPRRLGRARAARPRARSPPEEIERLRGLGDAARPRRGRSRSTCRSRACSACTSRPPAGCTASRRSSSTSRSRRARRS